MPEKVSIEEKIVELSILKAKEIIQELTHGKADIENKDPLVGEDVKVKRPQKNPKEVKVKNPVGKEGYGLAGQVSKMEQIHKALKIILKEENEDYTLNPEITSNEASPAERDEKRPARARANMAALDGVESSMDKLLEELQRGDITDRQYVDAFRPLLARLKQHMR
tara:strand:+ start:2761 stop:3258 length:498 start_codon:yes stop_codon:yes gene_type:complete